MSETQNPTEERLKKIEALRKEQNITRAHAASIVDAEAAQKTKTEAIKEAKA